MVIPCTVSVRGHFIVVWVNAWRPEPDVVSIFAEFAAAISRYCPEDTGVCKKGKLLAATECVSYQGEKIEHGLKRMRWKVRWRRGTRWAPRCDFL